MIAPNIEPNVDEIVIPNRFRLVYVVINPPNNRIASDGIGGNIFSIEISKNTPKYPY